MEFLISSPLKAYVAVGMAIIILLFFIWLLGYLFATLFKISPKKGKEYLHNVIYGTIGGLVAVALIETRDAPMGASWAYWVSSTLSLFIVILVFLCFGLIFIGITELLTKNKYKKK